MILCTDPGNKKESRSYNTSGRVTRVIDDYRGEVNRKYDLANNLVEETNAVGETMHYQYDAKGRVLQAEGHNGETIIYEYDNSGTDNLLSVTKKQSPDDKCYESKRTFEYDILGRPTAVTLYLSDDESYRTSLAYDWQDQLVQKTLPDTTVISQEFSGALLLSTNMKGIFGKVSTSYTDYNAFEKPEEWKLNGQGSTKADFSYKADYDMKGFPSSYALSTAPSLLVQNNYTYNDNDQLSLVLEQVSKDRSEYTYAAGRLFSSQHGGGDTNKYSYDLSGNLVEKGGLTFTYDSKKVTGNKGDKNVIAVTYDDVGRMVQRSANGTDYAYKYNDFGNIKIITNQKTQAIAKISSDHQGHTLVRSLPDGTREILISKDFEILIGRDKSRRIRRRIYSPDRLLATIRTDYLPKTSSSPQTEMHSMEVFFTDTKGNVTHAFEQDGKLRRRSKYDDFGLSTTSDDGDDSTTYEGRSYDGLTGLLDFGSRWYDPLLGRFTVPDNILDETALKRQDGINRYAFENNDPINHIDPTGNISKNAVWGILASVALIGASLLLSAATAGAFSGVAAILIGGVIGGLMGAGLAGLSYSWSHRDEQSSDKFWGGWLVSAGIGFGTGFVTGALGAWISNLVSVGRLVEAAKSVVTLIRVNQTAQNINRVATIMSIGGRALASSFASVVSKVSSNYIDQKYYGKNSDLWDGWYTAAAMGFVSGAALAGASDYYDAAGKERLNAAWDLVKKSREYKCENVFNEPGVWESFFRNSNASQSIPLIPGQAVSDGVKFGSGLIPHKNPFM
ncbi:hypothetical protein K7432_001094 [Basidiobolus ranarum]|uniref:Teneurin-like YD-shell domain-containing protein n=1 Tax=Basidiobolus ranarum TaxID=34480 RepID=A0ABR2X3Z9_9FUNG